MTFWLWVVARIVANPLSNVFQKLLAREQAAPLFVVGMTYGLLTIPCTGVLLIRPLPTVPEFWLNMAISAILALADNPRPVAAEPARSL